jgi:hypothetical protein
MDEVVLMLNKLDLVKSSAAPVQPSIAADRSDIAKSPRTQSRPRRPANTPPSPDRALYAIRDVSACFDDRHLDIACTTSRRIIADSFFTHH